MLAKILTARLPVWVVAIIVMFFSSCMAVQQLLLKSAGNKISELKKDNAILAAGIESQKNEVHKLKSQLATEALICMEQINDRVTISSILSSIKMNAVSTPVSSKAEYVNTSMKSNVKSGIDAEEAQVLKKEEVVSYEISTRVVDFINIHLDGM